MAVPTNKDELLAAIEMSFDKLIEELQNVPLSIVYECGMEGHAKATQMSISNLVGYLVGWNELVLKWLDRDAIGEPIDFPETGFKWNQLGILAQKFYRDTEGLPYPELVARLESAQAGIVSMIKARSNDTLYGHPWHTKWTMGRMIQFNTSSPYNNAYRRLRKYLKKLQSVSQQLS